MGNKLPQKPGNQQYIAFGGQQSPYHRGPPNTIAIDGTIYKPIIDEYLRSINIFVKYDKDRVLDPIETKYNEYRHIYKRERHLQFIWPQCVGIPMLYFDLNTHHIDWWIHMYRPYYDAMLYFECMNDRHGGVFILLGWIESYFEHQTVLHFDIQRRVQTFFDPTQQYDERMRDISLATDYIPHYHTPKGQPIQAIIERHGRNMRHMSPLDVCSVICFLLLVCCRRFGTTDIHGMSDIIQDLLLERPKDVSTIRYQMWLFYIELGEQGMQLSQLFAHVGLCGNATTTTTICTVMVQHAGSANGVPNKFPFTFW